MTHRRITELFENIARILLKTLRGKESYYLNLGLINIAKLLKIKTEIIIQELAMKNLFGIS